MSDRFSAGRSVAGWRKKENREAKGRASTASGDRYLPARRLPAAVRRMGRARSQATPAAMCVRACRMRNQGREVGECDRRGTTRGGPIGTSDSSASVECQTGQGANRGLTTTSSPSLARSAAAAAGHTQRRNDRLKFGFKKRTSASANKAKARRRHTTHLLRFCFLVLPKMGARLLLPLPLVRFSPMYTRPPPRPHPQSVSLRSRLMYPPTRASRLIL